VRNQMPECLDTSRLDSAGSKWVAGRASLRWFAGAELNEALQRFSPVGKARVGLALAGRVAGCSQLADAVLVEFLLPCCRCGINCVCRAEEPHFYTFATSCRAIQWASGLKFLSADLTVLVELWEAPTP
jgi:hypothetical protein